MVLAKVTSKGQVTIPLHVRMQAHIEPGTLLDFYLGPDGSITMRAFSQDLMGLKGIVKTKRNKPVSLEEMDAAIRRGVARKK